MSGGSWKVAYADFMTAMMAFFLLMWLLNVATPDQKAGIADMFTPGGTAESTVSSPIDVPSDAQQPQRQAMGHLQTTPLENEEIRETSQAIIRSLKKSLSDSLHITPASGLLHNDLGALMNLTPNVLFKAGSLELTPEGQLILGDVVDIMNKYNVYLIVRGHADKLERNVSGLNNPWDIASARANMAIQFLISKGVNAKHLRGIAYADTDPLVPNLNGPEAVNSRIEFSFHRPEVLSTLGTF